MKVGEVYQVSGKHRTLVYVVIEDYSVLRPLVLLHRRRDTPLAHEDERGFLSVNMARCKCEQAKKRGDSNFYDGAVKIADSLEEYMINIVPERILLGEEV